MAPAKRRTRPARAAAIRTRWNTPPTVTKLLLVVRQRGSRPGHDSFDDGNLNDHGYEDFASEIATF